jgi:arylsulfatase A-like enzyme
LGLERDTVIVFTSDNGSLGRDGGSNAPLRGGKGTTWEGGQRVPFLMSWPGTIPPGEVRPQLATSMDLLPTFVAMAGGTPAADRTIDGRDISGIVGAPDVPSPHDAFCYFSRDTLEAIRMDRWKLHLHKDGAALHALYDVVSDPAESTDLSGDRPDLVAHLSAAAERFRDDLGDAATGLPGTGCRPIGRVSDPQPLTRYDPTHPYIESMYDLPDRG